MVRLKSYMLQFNWYVLYCVSASIGCFIYISFFFFYLFQCTETIEWMINNNEKNIKKNNGHNIYTIASNNILKWKWWTNQFWCATNVCTKIINCHTCLRSLNSVSIFCFEIGNCHRKEKGEYDCWKSFSFGFTFHSQYDQTVYDWLTLSSGCLLFTMRLTFGQNEHKLNTHNIVSRQGISTFCFIMWIHNYSISPNLTVWNMKWFHGYKNRPTQNSRNVGCSMTQNYFHFEIFYIWRPMTFTSSVRFHSRHLISIQHTAYTLIHRMACGI